MRLCTAAKVPGPPFAGRERRQNIPCSFASTMRVPQPKSGSSLTVINQLFEFLSRLEEGDSFCRYAHGRSGFGVSSLAHPPVPKPKAAESADLDLVPLTEGVFNAIKNGIDDDLGLVLCQSGHLLGYLLDQLSLGHNPPSQDPDMKTVLRIKRKGGN